MIGVHLMSVGRFPKYLKYQPLSMPLVLQVQHRALVQERKSNYQSNSSPVYGENKYLDN